MNNITKTLSDSGYDFYFLVVDNFLDINIQEHLPNFYQIYAYKKEGIRSRDFCLESIGEKLPEKNTGRLISHPKVIEFIKNNSLNTGNKVAIIPFKPSAKLDLICKKNNWLNISNPSQLNRTLEDKIKFTEFCISNNIPIISSKIITLSKKEFLNAQKKFGNKLVLQTHFGWAGNSTYFANSWQEIKDKITSGTITKVSPFLEGYSLLNNCCLTKHGLIQSPPAIQYTGLSQFTQNPFATVGRQWPCLAPIFIQEKIKKISEQFSSAISKLNYKGFFGLDFFVDKNNNVFLLECNPRLTASFAFYTDIEIHNYITPLFFFHLLEFLKLKYSIDIKKEQFRFYNQNIIGSEITKKNVSLQTIQKINRFEIFSTTNNPIEIRPEIISLFENQKS